MATISNNEPVKGSTEEPSKISKGLQRYRWWRRHIGKDRTLYDFAKDACQTISPVVIAVIVTAPIAILVCLYQEHQKETESLRAQEIRKQQTLTQYFDQISSLTLDREIPIVPDNNEANRHEYGVRAIALNRTLVALHDLDGARKGQLIKFLYGAALINYVEGSLPPITLKDAEADLKDANLKSAKLYGADLRGVDLSGSNTDLTNAILTYAKLTKAKLVGAKLVGADLIEANLEEADLTNANLTSAKLGKKLKAKADKQKSHKQEGTNLTKAILKNTNLTEVNLTGIKLDPSTLKDAYLCHTTMPSGGNYPDPDRDCKKPLPKNTNLTDVDLTGIKLDSSTLKDAYLCRTTMPSGDDYPNPDRDCKKPVPALKKEKEKIWRRIPKFVESTLDSWISSNEDSSSKANNE
jgi:uncharacterized protein YjbI with pentapeptide repeats